jgi:hypothetical protein
VAALLRQRAIARENLYSISPYLQEAVVPNNALSQLDAQVGFTDASISYSQTPPPPAALVRVISTDQRYETAFVVKIARIVLSRWDDQTPRHLGHIPECPASDTISRLGDSLLSSADIFLAGGGGSNGRLKSLPGLGFSINIRYKRISG